jgi:RNA polymerase sigma-70 factor (ECF subfamily)
VYKTDTYVEVTDEVLDAMKAQDRTEANQRRLIRRYKAYHSLDSENGIERMFCSCSQSPDELLIEQFVQEQLYAAVMALPEKQAKRIYARYYLGMRVSEIAAAEGVDPSRVRDSIRRGLKQLAKFF